MHRFDGEQRLKGASWIWEDNTSPDRWLLLRKKFSLDAVPEAAEAYIAAETKYYLYINGRLAVFEGGLNRGPAPGCGYYDVVDIAPFLQKGENIIAAEVWYWGNEGRNNIDCGHGGFIFACPEAGVYSDSSWRMLANPAQVPVSDPYTEILYGGHDIGYDARRAPGDWKSAGYDEKQFAPACELGAAGDAPWGPLARRCVPLWRFSGIRQYTGIKKHYNTYTCALPHGMQVTPYLKISASGGELIDIRTDRYIIRGGPFFTQYKYKVQRCEYTAAEGQQEFEVLNWMYGENVIYTIPEGVEVIELGYRESGYDCDVINGFTSSDRDMNILAEKSAVTLYSCIRDNFMDCPDRERGQWIGDLAVQMPQVFYTLDRRADRLCLKAIWDIINFRRGD
ncbi:MAG: alpha-L-rhamnosidase N-terminal domain-containing protein, partial [Firmicutes bacterium]|nr:alpha-L-rhamnosidase N-terminal domain-containing protein [Bacillota bacterium]